MFLYKSLVLFIRKRDPRYKLRVSEGLNAPRGGHLLAETSAEAARRREEASLAYVEQAWQRVKLDPNDDDEWEGAEGGEEWECVACSRVFRSEAAWESHERSRKHMKEIERSVILFYIT